VGACREIVWEAINNGLRGASSNSGRSRCDRRWAPRGQHETSRGEMCGPAAEEATAPAALEDREHVRCRTAKWSAFNVSYFIELQIRDTPPTKRPVRSRCNRRRKHVSGSSFRRASHTHARARATYVLRRRIGCGSNDELRILYTQDAPAAAGRCRILGGK
jgi:hypothetical protein